MMVSMTRRDIVVGSGAAALAVLGAGGWVVIADSRKALLDYFKQELPGVSLDETSAGRCIDEFLSRWSWTEQRLVSVAWRTFGVESVGTVSDKFDLAARKALTMFLTNSNFFDTADPRAEIIVYTSSPPGMACANPFANLDPAA